MHRDIIDKTIINAGGLEYALTKLNKIKSTPPTTENLTLVAAIMDKANFSHKTILEEMYDNAILWRDLDLWKRVIAKYGQPSLSVTHWKKAAEAVATFDFAVLAETWAFSLLRGDPWSNPSGPQI